MEYSTFKKLKTSCSISERSEGSLIPLSGDDFFYRPLVEAISQEIIQSSGAKEITIDKDWYYTVNDQTLEEFWGDITPFFQVDFTVELCSFEKSHPGWDLHGFSGWGSAGAHIELILKVQNDEKIDLADFEPEIYNVLAHEIHHMTQHGAPLERPDAPPLRHSEQKTYKDYFLSDTEVPAFVVGFRAEAFITGLSKKSVMTEYLRNQVSAGLISELDLDFILDTWVNFRFKAA